jgi:hypothetical protein
MQAKTSSCQSNPEQVIRSSQNLRVAAEIGSGGLVMDQREITLGRYFATCIASYGVAGVWRLISRESPGRVLYRVSHPVFRCDDCETKAEAKLLARALSMLPVGLSPRGAA